MWVCVCVCGERDHFHADYFPHDTAPLKMFREGRKEDLNSDEWAHQSPLVVVFCWEQYGHVPAE